MIYTLVRKNSANVIDSIMSFDSIGSFDESWSATVTTQTVEKGFNISDNITIDPQSYDIQAVLSSYTLFDTNKEIVWDGETFNSEVTDKDRHIVARDKLIKLFTDRSVLTILESTANSTSEGLVFKEQELKSAHFKEIDNCVITSLAISNPDNATGAFLVSLKLQKVYVAYVTTVEVAEGQMTKLLQSYVKKDKSVAATAKSGQTVTDGEGDGLPIKTEDTTPKAVSQILEGMSFEDGAAYRDAVLKPIREEAEATRKAAIATALSKVYHVPDRQGGVWVVIPAF